MHALNQFFRDYVETVGIQAIGKGKVGAVVGGNRIFACFFRVESRHSLSSEEARREAVQLPPELFADRHGGAEISFVEIPLTEEQGREGSGYDHEVHFI